MTAGLPWEWGHATFRDREKARYVEIKAQLFSREACQPGLYRGRSRPFCLGNGYSVENLFPGFRKDAMAYFRRREITWHDGRPDFSGHKRAFPSNHLCCSQCACVNALWPLTERPDLLALVFRPFLPELAEPLPMDADGTLPSGAVPYIAFEWIGTQNYLGERGTRKRGANATSADFAFRYRRSDGRIQLVLGEWKYTEYYSRRPIAREKINPTRWETYREAFERWAQDAPKPPPYESFFVDPH